ncbi:hypothetical protein [Natrinema ejinorense]|uniref:Uncharacterized protein n=1 Tax=Natrinema ejinorense TaxID=373386 RepID=A0A2A5QY28_9EURY|nr:hypothetical protein [Natrinema ejinorense]PCR91740.1 hypothetical protein CP557_15135 [Natrinema ejinorense]
MTRSRLTRLFELRRLLPLVAAVLFVLALRVPVWRITLTAPQYVDPLVVELYAHPRIGGDWQEVRGLNKYVGFYYPDPVYVEPNYEPHEKAVDVPEWVLGPVVFIGMAVVSAVVAALPSRRISKGLTALFAGSIALFGAMGALIQYRLYQAGHSLDPEAPLNGVEGFTPPLAGTYEVANISGTAWFGPGGYMMVAGVVLLAIAFRYRGSDATITETPAILRGGWHRLRERIRRRGNDDEPSPAGTGRERNPDSEEGHRLETDGGVRPDAGSEGDLQRAARADRSRPADASGDDVAPDRRPRTPPDGDPP